MNSPFHYADRHVDLQLKQPDMDILQLFGERPYRYEGRNLGIILKFYGELKLLIAKSPSMIV